MMEYLKNNEAQFLRDVVLGQHAPDFWSDDARQALAAKLERLMHWAIKEDAARERLSQAWKFTEGN